MLPSLRVEQEEVERFQLNRAKKFLDQVTTHHPFYRQVLADKDLESFSTLADLDRIPITEKSELVARPDDFRLEQAGGEFYDTWDVTYTTGTTSQPTPIYQSRYDYDRIIFAQRRMADIRGLDSSDTIANLFPLASQPNGSWIRVNDHAFAIGARLVAGFGGPAPDPLSPTRRLPEVASVVARARPSVLWGVSSFLRRFLGECVSRGLELPEVRMIVVSGEALDPSVRSGIRAAAAQLSCESVEISPGFGASELQCSLVACGQGFGLHNPAPELFVLQVADENGETLPSGGTGRLVLTHLDRRGTVVVRYALGDTVTLEREKCPGCGRSGERITTHHGRSDARTKIRGQLVDLDQVLSRDCPRWC